MFYESQFNQDISDWKPFSLKNKEYTFNNSVLEKNNNLPYWANIEPKFINSAINYYHLQKKLNQELNQNTTNKKLTVKV